MADGQHHRLGTSIIMIVKLGRKRQRQRKVVEVRVSVPQYSITLLD